MGSHQRWNKAKISCELTFKSSKFKIITRATSSIFISIRPSLTRFTNGAYGFLTRCIHVRCIFRHYHWHILNLIFCSCYTVEEFHRILDNSVLFHSQALDELRFWLWLEKKWMLYRKPNEIFPETVLKNSVSSMVHGYPVFWAFRTFQDNFVQIHGFATSAISESKRGSQASQKVCSISLRLPLKRTRSYRAYEFWVINLFTSFKRIILIKMMCFHLYNLSSWTICENSFLRDRDLHEITLVVTL